MERLEDAQREIYIRQTGLYNPVYSSAENDQGNQEDIKYEPFKIFWTITEIPTKWELKLASWKRLQKLKEPINRLYATLALETDRKSKNDYKRLKNLMCNDNKWNLLDKLIEILIPIERATEFLGGQKYCTLSLIFPTIQTLKFEYTPDPNIALIERNDNGKTLFLCCHTRQLTKYF